MPTYDYSCDACHHEFEVFEPITAEPQKKCPKCKKNKLRRLFGAGAGIVFKGSGFYQTDYRSDSYRKAAEADKPKTDSAKTESTKSDTAAAPADAAPKTETKSDSPSRSDSKSKKPRA
jgi:putative FmdB family regulatory protein